MNFENRRQTIDALDGEGDTCCNKEEDESESLDLTEVSYTTFGSSFRSLSSFQLVEVAPFQDLSTPIEAEEDEYSSCGVVQFDKNLSFGVSASTKEDAHDLWYDAEDYKYFKQEVATKLRRLVQDKTPNSMHCKQVMKIILKGARNASESSNSRCEAFYQKELEELYYFVEQEDELVGLESYYIRSRFQDGRQVRLEMLMDRIEVHYDFLLSDSPSDPDQRAKELASDCMDISLPSRIVARELAQARAVLSS
mmetsp:Transcript_6897/g.8944  ORF Transcript_6897/g.8944 Transcript_6897/m.8944 type:complete len:252 (-) Transcript_6897:179-934(-)